MAVPGRRSPQARRRARAARRVEPCNLAADRVALSGVACADEILALVRSLRERGIGVVVSVDTPPAA